MVRLVVARRRDDRARTRIPGRELLQVPARMLLDLALGLGEKRGVPAVAEQPRAQADASRERSAEGAGLGLAIVAAIMALHAGRATASGSPGSDTSFTLHFPAARAAG